MYKLFRQYFLYFCRSVPVEWYERGLVFFCIVAVVLVGWLGWEKGWRKVAALLLVEFVFFIFGSTVFFREALTMARYDYTPFWSYKEILNGRDDLLVENIMNIAIFLPTGLLLGMTSRKMTWRKVVMIGGFFSVLIEILQYVFQRGLSEVDDIMHNTVGCLIGYGIYKICAYVYELLSKSRMTV